MKCVKKLLHKLGIHFYKFSKIPKDKIQFGVDRITVFFRECSICGKYQEFHPDVGWFNVESYLTREK